MDGRETLAEITRDEKLQHMATNRRKSMEWLAQMGEHVSSLDAFREEVRASLEPLFSKLEAVDDLVRILRHATADVGRRVEDLEKEKRMAG